MKSDVLRDINMDFDEALKSVPADKLDQLFDVLSDCVEGRYMFIEYVPKGVSRWSREAVEYFGLPGTHIRNGARIWGSLSFRMTEHPI